jgi:membrane peptidoglycan carboxypeptidase
MAPTLSRKVNEAVEAYKMNNSYSKDQILAAYLNIVYFGRHAYGIESAAQAYFGVKADQLTMTQAALVAGMIQKPGHGNDPAVELARWQYVMRQLHANNWVTQEYYDANHAMTQFPPTVTYQPGGPTARLPWDRQLIVQQVEDELNAKGWSLDAIQRNGGKIYTTIDQNAQQDAENSVAKILAPDTALTDGQPKTLNGTAISGKEGAALVSLNPSSGGVIAWYGGNDPTKNSYDEANIPHQPGSSFKPYVFATGLEVNPTQIGLNAVYNGSDNQMIGGRTVHNSDGENCATCTVKDAMTQSINTVFYSMGYNIGTGHIRDVAYSLGISKTERDSLTGAQVPSLITNNATPPNVEGGISIGQYPVRPLDQAQGYATLDNGGMYMPAHFVAKMTDNSGNTLYQFTQTGTPAFDGDPAKSAQIAHTVIDAMTGVATPQTGLNLANNRPNAAKTGTQGYNDPRTGVPTGHNSDAWMVGFTPQVVTAVWFGNTGSPGPILGNYHNGKGGSSQQHNYNVYGREEPAYIWQDYMNTYLANQPVQQFPAVTDIGGSWNFVTGQDMATATQAANSNNYGQSTGSQTSSTTDQQQPSSTYQHTTSETTTTTTTKKHGPPTSTTTCVVFCTTAGGGSPPTGGGGVGGG